YYKAMGGAGNLRVSALVDLPTKYLGNQVAPTDPDDPQPNAADAILSDSTNSIKNGGLEASSTDVANEFAEMITTQRGYQANTRIITVTDSMLEELVNMKR
ncbi:MAG: flagellar hook-basal body protein, partial [Lawsonibacter sp.]|nr:flagellar hook-basal body protein [Lawsonibacter sp.]